MPAMLPTRLRYSLIGALAFVVVTFVFYQAETTSASRYNDWYALWWLSNYGLPAAPAAPATVKEQPSTMNELAASDAVENNLAESDLIQKTPYGDNVEEAVRAAMEHEIINHRQRPDTGVTRPADLPAAFDWPAEVGTINQGLSGVDISNAGATQGFAVGPEGLEIAQPFDASAPQPAPALSPIDLSAADPFSGSAVGPAGLAADAAPVPAAAFAPVDAAQANHPAPAVAPAFAAADLTKGSVGHSSVSLAAPDTHAAGSHADLVHDSALVAASNPALDLDPMLQAAPGTAGHAATEPAFGHAAFGPGLDAPAPALPAAGSLDQTFSHEAFGPGLGVASPPEPVGPPPGLHDVGPPLPPPGHEVMQLMEAQAGHGS